MKPFKPMLAASLVSPRDTEEVLLNNLKSLHFPVLATPKLDGIRCLTLDAVGMHKDNISLPVCRSLKPVPNHQIRDAIGMLIPGLDGEILTYSERDLLDQQFRPRDFNDIQSDVMCYNGRSHFTFNVFDCDIFGDDSYYIRVEKLRELVLPDFCIKVLPTVCRNVEELQEFMSKCINEGHEGICFRSSMYCPYKCGRSTLKQEWLVKWKLFETSEATIIGFEEEMHNANEATTGLLGQVERSSHQAGMVGKGRLGAFIVTTGPDQVEFKIGTGFTADQRQDYWNRRDELLEKTVTFKHQVFGANEAPRIPVFVGIRSALDMS